MALCLIPGIKGETVVMSKIKQTIEETVKTIKGLACFRPTGAGRIQAFGDGGALVKVDGLFQGAEGITYTNRFGSSPGQPVTFQARFDSVEEAEASLEDDEVFRSIVTINYGEIAENNYFRKDKNGDQTKELVIGRPTLTIGSFDPKLLRPADKSAFRGTGSGMLRESADNYST